MEDHPMMFVTTIPNVKCSIYIQYINRTCIKLASTSHFTMHFPTSLTMFKIDSQILEMGDVDLVGFKFEDASGRKKLYFKNQKELSRNSLKLGWSNSLDYLEDMERKSDLGRYVYDPRLHPITYKSFTSSDVVIDNKEIIPDLLDHTTFYSSFFLPFEPKHYNISLNNPFFGHKLNLPIDDQNDKYFYQIIKFRITKNILLNHGGIKLNIGTKIREGGDMNEYIRLQLHDRFLINSYYLNVILIYIFLYIHIYIYICIYIYIL